MPQPKFKVGDIVRPIDVEGQEDLIIHVDEDGHFEDKEYTLIAIKSAPDNVGAKRNHLFSHFCTVVDYHGVLVRKASKAEWILYAREKW